jgi:hypothetical protein
VRPVMLTAAQLHALGNAVLAYYTSECQSWVEKGMSDKWAEDWSHSVVAPAVEAFESVKLSFDGAFD